MADTTQQMEVLKDLTSEQAAEKGHSLGAYQEYAGGAVNVAECGSCKRWALAEIYPFGTDSRGSALTLDCGGRKVQ